MGFVFLVVIQNVNLHMFLFRSILNPNCVNIWGKMVTNSLLTEVRLDKVLVLCKENRSMFPDVVDRRFELYGYKKIYAFCKSDYVESDSC